MTSLSDCLRCGYKLGKDGSQQQGAYVEQQANDIFSALMEDEEEEDLEGPMVDWSQTTFTMDDVTIEVSQYNDEGDISLSSTPNSHHSLRTCQRTQRTSYPQR